MARILSWLTRPALLRSLVGRLRLAGRLLREPAVPLVLKALTLVPALYVISPIDVLPDVLPVLGRLDDLGVVILALEGFLSPVPWPHCRSPSPGTGGRQALLAGRRSVSRHGRRARDRRRGVASKPHPPLFQIRLAKLFTVRVW